MRRRLIRAVLPLALVFSSASLAQTPTDRLTPTIPETQIEPAPLSSPFQFLSVATSGSDFVIEAAALASANAESGEVKSMAADFSAAHAAIIREISAAGKADAVDIATPAVDGEQRGLLGKIEALKGSDFDAAYIDSQLFGLRRAISYYRGYADEPNNLGAFAKKTLPTLVAQYESLLVMAERFAGAKPAVQQ